LLRPIGPAELLQADYGGGQIGLRALDNHLILQLREVSDESRLENRVVIVVRSRPDFRVKARRAARGGGSWAFGYRPCCDRSG
jgi:hypothetical protein